MPDDITRDLADCGGELPQIVDDGTNNNYDEWETKSYHKLRSWDLWKYIDGPESTPPITPVTRRMSARIEKNSAECQENTDVSRLWTAANNLALSKIVSAVPGTRIHLVKQVRYAKQAWQCLRSVYQPLNPPGAASIKDSIVAYRCTSDMDVARWVDDMQRLYNTLCNMDTECLSDRCFTLVVLDNMTQHGSWRAFLSALRAKVRGYDSHQPTPTPLDSTEFLTAIRNEYWHRNPNNPEISSHFFSARTDAGSNTQKRPNPPDASTSTPVKRLRGSDEPCTDSKCGIRLDDEITITGQLDMPKDDSCYYITSTKWHVFHDKTAFETYETIKPVAEKGFASNMSANAIGRGTIRVEGNFGYLKPLILLEQVLHIPTARFNMISGSRVDKAAISVTLGKGEIKLLDRGSAIVGGKLSNDLYRLNLGIMRSSHPRPLYSPPAQPNPSRNIYGFDKERINYII